MRRRPAHATVPEPASQQNCHLVHVEHHKNLNAVKRATNKLTAFRAVAI
ncbi:MAG TPA: hypothetical protein VFH39_00300 [Candidatus Saccharimonadales bacterium]|nr:hypothetical protein [Candidatus Saccharimonadales bacterium]